jgi:hypothetical protein
MPVESQAGVDANSLFLTGRCPRPSLCQSGNGPGRSALAVAAIRSAVPLLLSIVPLVNGCGLMFLGKTQEVTLRTTPPEAVASLAGEQTTTPGKVTIRRNQRRGWAVFRAERTGYQPACRLVGGRRTIRLIILDALPLAIPLAIDASTVGLRSMRRYPSTVHLTLHPLENGERPKSLPSNEEVLDAWLLGRVNLCNSHASSTSSFDGRGWGCSPSSRGCNVRCTVCG